MIRTPLATAAAAILALGLAAAAAAAEEAARAGDLVIADAYARATLGRATNTAAYLTIEATGDRPDRLVGAASPAARAVELHAHVMDGGVARMRPVDAIEIDPGAPVVLQPGGLHLMVIGLGEPLAEGATLPLTLTFERNGEITLELPVRGVTPGGTGHGGPGAAPGHGHHGGPGTPPSD
ncbi:MAG TPA: copper chaperone PCu(A)C [Geminicoccaceae bacterium]|nr:copper chaperone PCu(A)C [Geminicoccaceae bacterium]